MDLSGSRSRQPWKSAPADGAGDLRCPVSMFFPASGRPAGAAATHGWKRPASQAHGPSFSGGGRPAQAAAAGPVAAAISPFMAAMVAA